MVCLTSYTAPIAKIADKFADIILVGDSVGPVLYGLETTKNVSLDMMILHAKAVVKNSKKALIIVDMPFGTYEKSGKLAYENAKKIISETGADIYLKLEGGKKISSIVKYLSKKLLVVGHLGLLPQSFSGKYRVFGKKMKKKTIIQDLNSLQKSGVFNCTRVCG